MDVTEHNTIACNANLHPHKHRLQGQGPWNLRIGVRSQPTVIREWKSKKVYVSMEQTEEDTNFTIIRVMFLKGGHKKPSFVAGCDFKVARVYRRSDEVIEVRLKNRYTNSFPHPLPLGKYDGSCMYEADGGFAVFTLQAMTLRKEPKPPESKIIITPGDAEYGVTLRDAKKSFLRTDGMEGGGTNAGGLRDGELPDGISTGSSGEGMGRFVRPARDW